MLSKQLLKCLKTVDEIILTAIFKTVDNVLPTTFNLLLFVFASVRAFVFVLFLKYPVFCLFLLNRHRNLNIIICKWWWVSHFVSENVSVGWVTSWRKCNNSFLSLFDQLPFSLANPLYHQTHSYKEFPLRLFPKMLYHIPIP